MLLSTERLGVAVALPFHLLERLLKEGVTILRPSSSSSSSMLDIVLSHSYSSACGSMMLAGARRP